MTGRPKKTIATDEEIAKQEEAVSKAKQKYDECVKRLKDLYAKKDEQRKKELFEAVERSTKSYDEIMKFLEDKE